MKELEAIASVTGSFLPDFLNNYQEVLTSQDPLVANALAKIKHTNGKHIRPLLMGLVVKLLGKEITSSVIDASVLLELLHAASLIHDDVIDLSPLRRGEPTLNAIYGNHVSVLVGDYVLAKCFHYAVAHCDKAIMEVVALAGMFLSIGEMHQAKATQELQVISEEEYLKIIEKKTGTLFEATTTIGSLCAKASDKEQKTLAHLGRAIGLAFQIKDDLFDYYEESQTGKPAGLDLQEGKATLPLIYVYHQADSSRQEEITKLLREASKSQSARRALVQIAHEGGGVDYAKQRLDEILHEAEAIIKSFPSSDAQEALLKLCNFLYIRSF